VNCEAKKRPWYVRRRRNKRERYGNRVIYPTYYFFLVAGSGGVANHTTISHQNSVARHPIPSLKETFFCAYLRYSNVYGVILDCVKNLYTRFKLVRVLCIGAILIQLSRYTSGLWEIAPHESTTHTLEIKKDFITSADSRAVITKITPGREKERFQIEKKNR